MRILMINHEFTVTGSSTFFHRLAAHLQSQGHRIELFPCNPEDGPIKPRYEALGIPVIGRAVLAEYDLAIANTICAAPMVLRVAPQLKTIWFVNEAEIGLNIILQNPELADAFKLAAAVIYNMPFQHDVYRSFTWSLDQTKFHTAPLGVDAGTPGSVPAKTRPLRAVQVGTVEPRKRPGDFLLAAARSGLDVEAIVIGKFYELAEPAQRLLAREPDKYRILQGLADDEVLGYVASADFFCLCSGSETQALAAYEAAQLARPLILSDLPCYRGVFAHGRNCLMYPTGEIDLAAMSMQIYAANPTLRDRLGKAAATTASGYTNAGFFARFGAILGSVAPAHH